MGSDRVIVILSHGKKVLVSPSKQRNCNTKMITHLFIDKISSCLTSKVEKKIVSRQMIESHNVDFQVLANRKYCNTTGIVHSRSLSLSPLHFNYFLCPYSFVFYSTISKRSHSLYVIVFKYDK